ncbi:uncharacterized protein LOC129883478 [Solanum dulcamara]|uniref:uncharacterized protein LOC129883478 n=1 Tax=Solanum dulcamara TaxID=45834 RepID=UPI002486B703|nr:uncharacterized protein LOC129883478 [Solanum dulcamara]
MAKVLQKVDAIESGVRDMRGNMTNISQLVDSHSTSIKQLEHQIGQLSAIFNQRKTGTLPSDMIKDATFEVDGKARHQPDKVVMFDDDDEADELVLEKKRTEENNGTKQTVAAGPHYLPPVRQPLPPFPHRLKKKTEDDKFLKFILLLKEISINIPLVEVLEHMPGYVKFMKDLVTKKRTIFFEPTDNLHHYSAIATRLLVEKKEDSSAFTIPYTIGAFDFAKALCDLGASTNLMSLAITDRWDWEPQIDFYAVVDGE